MRWMTQKAAALPMAYGGIAQIHAGRGTLKRTAEEIAELIVDAYEDRGWR